MDFRALYSSIENFLTAFCKNPKNKIQDYGANLAGIFWNTGNAAQLLLGAILFSPRVILASIFNTSSALSAMVLGHKNWGIVVNAILGLAGTILTLYPGLANGEGATIAGLAFFSFGEIFGLFNPLFYKKFGSAKNALLRESIGSPRRMQGGIIFVSRVPVIITSVIHADLPILIPFCLWATGDIFLAISKSERAP